MNLLSLVARLTLDSSEYDKGLQGITKAASTVGKAAAVAIGAATTAVTGFAAASVAAGMNFDQSMSKVAAISGATGEDFDKLRDKAQEMGANTKFSATQAADAFSYMAMAGWKTNDMLDGIEGVMNLAAASGEDLATTSDIVTDALTAFGLKAEDSGHFADILAAASSNANTNVSMMGETFKYAAPIAGAMGFSAEDTAEAIGLMANAGIKASQAGTSLRVILNQMSGPIKISGKALGNVAINTTKADGSMRDLSDILDDCRKAFDKLTPAEKAQAAESIAGKNAMSGFLAIMNAGQDDIDKLRTSIEKCDGSAKDMAETMQDNLAGDITIFKSAVEGAQIAISDELTPTLRDFVQFGTKGVSQITTAFKKGGFDKAVAIFGDLLAKGVTKVMKMAPSLIRSGVGLLTSFGKGMLKSVPKIISDTWNTMKNVLLTNGVQKAAWALNKIITGGAEQGFTTSAQRLRDRFTKLLNEVFEAVGNVIDIGKSLFDGLVDVWTTVFQPIFQEALSFLLDRVLPVVNSALSLLNDGLSKIPSIIGDVVNAIKNGNWGQAGSIIWESIKGGFNAVSGWLLKLVLGEDYTPESGWGDAGAKIWGAIKDGFAVVNDWLIKLLMGEDWKPESGWGDVGDKIWSAIKAGFAVVNDWLLKLVLGEEWTPEAGWSDAGAKIWESIKSGFAAVSDWLIKLVMGEEWTPEAGWGDAGAKIWQAIKDGFAITGDWLKKLLLGEEDYTPDATWSEVGTKIWGKIIEGFSSAVDWLKNLFDDWTAKLADGSIDFASIGTTIGSTVWGAIKDAFNTVVDWFKYLFGGNSDEDQNSVKGAIFSIDWAGLGTSIFDFIAAAFSGIVEAYKGYFQSALDAIKDLDWAGLGDAMWSAITGAFSTISSWFTETFRGPINTVIDYINEMITNFENAFNRVIDSINYLLGTNFERKVFARVQKIYDTVYGTNTVYGGGGGNLDRNAGTGRRKVRGYASGGILRNGDAGIVGEYQPEFLQMINGKAVVTPMNTGRFPGGGGAGQEVVVPRNQSRDLTVILELDRQQMGKMVYKLNNEETQRVGVRLSRGGAY